MGAKVKEVYDCNIVWVAYGCSIMNCYISGNPPNLFCQDFEIIYPNAPEISFGQWLIFCATIKFNNVCRNFSCSLYYVSSTKDFEVLDKSFSKKI
jgi:sodium-dependent dicarboxylate transporter 2/3/5